MADNNKNIEQNGATTHPEDNGGQPEGKMFTQDEVNRIVSERLARERSKLSDQTELEAREQAVSIKEKALNDRIIKLELQSLDGYDHKLLERLIDLSGVKVDEAGTVTGLKEAVESVVQEYPVVLKPKDIPSFGRPTPGFLSPSGRDNIAEAFGLNHKNR